MVLAQAENATRCRDGLTRSLVWLVIFAFFAVSVSAAASDIGGSRVTLTTGVNGTFFYLLNCGPSSLNNATHLQVLTVDCNVTVGENMSGGDYFINVMFNNSDVGSLYNVSTPVNVSVIAKGGVVPVNGSRASYDPFWTPDVNPCEFSNVSGGEYLECSWVVNASGPVGNYSMFSFWNYTSVSERQGKNNNTDTRVIEITSAGAAVSNISISNLLFNQTNYSAGANVGVNVTYNHTNSVGGNVTAHWFFASGSVFNETKEVVSDSVASFVLDSANYSVSGLVEVYVNATSSDEVGTQTLTDSKSVYVGDVSLAISPSFINASTTMDLNVTYSHNASVNSTRVFMNVTILGVAINSTTCSVTASGDVCNLTSTNYSKNDVVVLTGLLEVSGEVVRVETLNFTINNSLPNISIPDQNVSVGQTWLVQSVCQDPDGDSLTMLSNDSQFASAVSPNVTGGVYARSLTGSHKVNVSCSDDGGVTNVTGGEFSVFLFAGNVSNVSLLTLPVNVTKSLNASVRYLHPNGTAATSVYLNATNGSTGVLLNSTTCASLASGGICSIDISNYSKNDVINVTALLTGPYSESAMIQKNNFTVSNAWPSIFFEFSNFSSPYDQVVSKQVNCTDPDAADSLSMVMNDTSFILINDSGNISGGPFSVDNITSSGEALFSFTDNFTAYGNNFPIPHQYWTNASGKFDTAIVNTRGTHKVARGGLTPAHAALYALLNRTTYQFNITNESSWSFNLTVVQNDTSNVQHARFGLINGSGGCLISAGVEGGAASGCTGSPPCIMLTNHSNVGSCGGYNTQTSTTFNSQTEYYACLKYNGSTRDLNLSYGSTSSCADSSVGIKTGFTNASMGGAEPVTFGLDLFGNISVTNISIWVSDSFSIVNDRVFLQNTTCHDGTVNVSSIFGWNLTNLSPVELVLGLRPSVINVTVTAIANASKTVQTGDIFMNATNNDTGVVLNATTFSSVPSGGTVNLSITNYTKGDNITITALDVNNGLTTSTSFTVANSLPTLLFEFANFSSPFNAVVGKQANCTDSDASDTLIMSLNDTRFLTINDSGNISGGPFAEANISAFLVNTTCHDSSGNVSLIFGWNISNTTVCVVEATTTLSMNWTQSYNQTYREPKGQTAGVGVFNISNNGTGNDVNVSIMLNESVENVTFMIANVSNTSLALMFNETKFTVFYSNLSNVSVGYAWLYANLTQRDPGTVMNYSIIVNCSGI